MAEARGGEVTEISREHGRQCTNLNPTLFRRGSHAPLVTVRRGDSADENFADAGPSVGEAQEAPVADGVSVSVVVNNAGEAIQLPQSTHSLLFTTDALSLPFGLAVLVLFVSVMCLLLSLLDNLSGGDEKNPLDVPANVSRNVRAAQYFSILIALVMEEEIPAGTYLLRMIPRSSVERLGLSYEKFVASAMCRLAIGYMFLLNVFLVIVQGDRVLDIFYDMLALSFVSMIDDIAFQLAKYDALGKTLRVAASAKCFGAEFTKKPYAFRKKMTHFVKFLFVFNLLFFLGGVITITGLQKEGYFQCNDITVMLGEDIWEHAWARIDGNLKRGALVYSYFNGVYRQNGTHDGRPVYQELRKSDDSYYETKIPAEIKYCKSESAWVLTHEDIKKSESQEESPCPWLLRSPETKEYDLMYVSGTWEIWVGRINHGATMDITCNGCNDNTDCNLNGVCTDDGCNCDSTNYYGHHCELEEPCPSIIDIFADSWTGLYTRKCGILLEYGRSVYSLRNFSAHPLMNDVTFDQDKDIVNLVFTGSRWVVLKFEGGRSNTLDQVETRALEYHAFWETAFDGEMLAISDPTSRSYPVGVDFYKIGERGEQYGPFGVLHPLQEPPGRGLFRCDKNVTDRYSSFFTHCIHNQSNS